MNAKKPKWILSARSNFLRNILTILLSSLLLIISTAHSDTRIYKTNDDWHVEYDNRYVTAVTVNSDDTAVGIICEFHGLCALRLDFKGYCVKQGSTQEMTLLVDERKIGAWQFICDDVIGRKGIAALRVTLPEDIIEPFAYGRYVTAEGYGSEGLRISMRASLIGFTKSISDQIYFLDAAESRTSKPIQNNKLPTGQLTR